MTRSPLPPDPIDDALLGVVAIAFLALVGALVAVGLFVAAQIVGVV